MPIGYARVSKADGSQTTDSQGDALLVEGEEKMGKVTWRELNK